MRINKSLSLILFILATAFLTSCFLYKETTTKSIYRNSNSKKNYLTVKTFTHSHCGCTDIYAQKFDNGKLTYEFYYGSTPFFQAQKILYTYSSNGELIATNKFRLVDTTFYNNKFDSLDLFVLKKIDSFRVQQNPGLPEYKLCKKEYKGLIKFE